MHKNLFALIFLLLASCFVSARTANYDLIDPRLPDHDHDLLYRIRVSEGYTQNYGFELVKDSLQSDFNRRLFDQIGRKRNYLLTYNKDNIKSHIALNFRENWLGIREGNSNISNLQSSLAFTGQANLNDKVEFEHEVKIFRSDSSYNLYEASTTGEFLHDPLLSYNFPTRGPITSESYVIEVQSDKALIKTELLGIKLQTGRDRPQFKIGYRNSLIMTGLARPIDMYYRIDYRVWRIGFTALSGQLTDAGKRYISLKRIYFQFARWLQIGGTEGVAYADDPTAYINPMLFFYIVHRHRPTNEDNLIATYDISINPIKSLNIYFEFLNDDFILFQGGASKYGICTGFLKTGLFNEKLDIRAEYTHVRKWTYTHVSHVNAWEYRDQPFGFWLGPDADEGFARAEYIISPVSAVSFNFNILRKGEGDLFHPWEDEQGDKNPPFPSGTIEKSTAGWIDFRHELKNIEMRGRFGYRKINNRHNQPGDYDSYFAHWGLSYTL